MKNYYEILEVREHASSEVIEMAYKALVKKYHPDVYQGDSAFAHHMTQQINEAHNTLADPELRKAYDESLLDADGPSDLSPKKTGFGSMAAPSPGAKHLALSALLLILCIVLAIFSIFSNRENGRLKENQLSLKGDLKLVETELSDQKATHELLLEESHSMAAYLGEYYERACFTSSFSDEYHRFGCPRTEGRALTILDVKNAKRLGYTPCPDCWDKPADDFY